MFFIVTVPLFSEGSLILELDGLDMKTVTELCNKDMALVEKENSILANALLNSAHRFDQMQNTIINSMMFKADTERLNENGRTFDLEGPDFSGTSL